MPKVTELAIIIPTRDRRDLLLECLARLKAFAGGEPVEVIVVDDGSGDGSAEAARGAEQGPAWRFDVISQPAAGPATARNRGIREATAATCLFIGDDTLPTPELIAAHLDFHRRHPGRTDAMLGLVVPAPPLGADPLQVWLHEQGTQFGYGSLEPGSIVSPTCFWTSNVSAKRDLLLEAGGFDEGFPGAACEDAELGIRLAREGMRLHYEPRARSEHFHPTDLDRVLGRMRVVGVAMRRLCELAPEMPKPARPTARHRAKAAGLTLAHAVVRRQSTREAAWRFLCDEALRESYWADSTTASESHLPRIGSALGRLMRSEKVANPPLADFPPTYSPGSAREESLRAR